MQAARRRPLFRLPGRTCPGAAPPSRPRPAAAGRRSRAACRGATGAWGWRGGRGKWSVSCIREWRQRGDRALLKARGTPSHASTGAAAARALPWPSPSPEPLLGHLVRQQRHGHARVGAPPADDLKQEYGKLGWVGGGRIRGGCAGSGEGEAGWAAGGGAVQRGREGGAASWRTRAAPRGAGAAAASPRRRRRPLTRGRPPVARGSCGWGCPGGGGGRWRGGGGSVGDPASAGRSASARPQRGLASPSRLEAFWPRRLTRATSVACVSVGGSGKDRPKSATFAVSRCPAPSALPVSITLLALRSPGGWKARGAAQGGGGCLVEGRRRGAPRRRAYCYTQTAAHGVRRTSVRPGPTRSAPPTHHARCPRCGGAASPPPRRERWRAPRRARGSRRAPRGAGSRARRAGSPVILGGGGGADTGVGGQGVRERGPPCPVPSSSRRSRLQFNSKPTQPKSTHTVSS
jgi:hypothetical protein